MNKNLFYKRKNSFFQYLLIYILFFSLQVAFAADLKSTSQEEQEEAQMQATQENTLLKESAKDYYQKGLRASSQSLDQEAITYFSKAITLDKSFAAAYNSLGIIYERNKDVKKAEEMYLKAIAVDKNYFPAYSNMALLNESRQDFTAALQYWKKRVSYCNPSDKLTQQAELRIKELGGDQVKKQENAPVKVKADFEPVKTKPAVNQVNLTSVSAPLPKTTPATTNNFAKLKNLAPKQEPGQTAEEKQTLVLKKENEKLKKENEEIRNQRAKLYEDLGTAYTQAKLYDLAIEAYLKSLEFNPMNAEIHYNLGLLYKQSRNNLKKSIYHLNKFLQLDREGRKDKEVKYLIDMLKETPAQEYD